MLKLKGFIKRHIHQKVVLNLDVAYTGTSQTVLLGWLVNKGEKSPSDVVDCLLQGSRLESSQMTFKRSDVESHLNLKVGEKCFGFIIVFEAVDSLEEVKLVFENNKFSIKKQNYILVSSTSDLLAHVSSDANSATEFLKKCGLKFNSPSQTSSNVIRKQDHDVEKIKSVLNLLNIHSHDFYDKCLNEVLPDVQKIWKARQVKSNNSILKVFGEQPQSPFLTIIVPLYGRYDFIQHQIAHFSRDDSMKNVELIYVLDDPALAHELDVTAFGVHQTFAFPFKVIFSEHNLGFSGANNLGVSFATSEHVLLLNSDIIPSKNGWVLDYFNQFNELPDCGILGATLIYEDNTIQHAGMEFRTDSSYPGIWMNHHPYKGLPLSLLSLSGISEVQLVTGASMLMKKALFNDIGGFDILYVLGDFEDSDLCLKCIDRGWNIYLSYDVVFYHLERLSQNLVDSGDWKFKLTLANGIYQSHKWQSLIKEVMT